MRHRTTTVLLVLFFGGLGALWYADHARVPGRRERQVLANRLIPELIDTPPGEIVKVEVDRGPAGESVTLERREGGRWQLTRPLDAAADAETAETLVRNLKDLRKSADAGTIEGDGAGFGLAPPEATLRLFVKGQPAPVTLDVGKSLRERVYVRPGAGSGVEVVDARLLSAVGRTAAAWRDAALFRMPSFRVESVTVDETAPKRVVKAQRDERRWRLVSPIVAPADEDKVEGLVAELSALHVADAALGFVENDLRDPARYGLDAPSMTVTLAPFPGGGAPQVVRFGKAVPDRPDQVYAVRGDQDDVVRVDVKRLREAIAGPNALRSPKVLEFTPGRVSRFRIKTPVGLFDLARTASGWEVISPAPGLADTASVQSLLTRLADLTASEFFEPSQVVEPRLDPPSYRIQIWQPARGKAETTAAPGEPQGELRADLSLGRDDRLKKSVYGRLKDDPTVMALPEDVLKELPRDTFAFRDRTVLRLNPEQVARFTVERPGSKVTVVPIGLSGKGMKSRIVEPMDAPTDEGSVTSLLLALANLRAEKWEGDVMADPRAYGLDAPWIRVKWTTQDAATPEPGARKAGGDRKGGGTLRIGGLKPGPVAFYANIEGDPRVFSLNGGVVSSFEAELHDRTVFAFKPETADRVTLQWPGRTLTLRGEPGAGSAPAWIPEPGIDPSGFRVESVGPLVTLLSDLKTTRYLQYEGPIGESAGLNPPRLSVRVRHTGGRGESYLRVGNRRSDGTCLATTAAGDDGPVFLFVPDENARSLLRPPSRPGDLPDDPFAPGPGPAAGPGGKP